MLYNIISDCIEGELLHGFKLGKKEINDYFEKLKNDNRFIVLKNSYYFYKEESIQDILKDYPELDEVIKDHDSLDTYIEDKYQDEDVEIGNKMATINIDSLDLIGLILYNIKRYTDDELFNDLESVIKNSEKSAKFSLIRQSFQSLFNEVDKYVSKEESNVFIDWDIVKRDIPVKEGLEVENITLNRKGLIKLVSNFKKEKKTIYEKAIKIYEKETGNNSLYIDEDAYSKRGIKEESMYSLKGLNKDYSKFWRILESIKENEEE